MFESLGTPEEKARLLVFGYAFGTQHRQGNIPLQIWKAKTALEESRSWYQSFTQLRQLSALVPGLHCPGQMSWKAQQHFPNDVLEPKSAHSKTPVLAASGWLAAEAVKCLQKNNP